MGPFTLPNARQTATKLGYASDIQHNVTERLRTSNYWPLRNILCLTSDDVVCLIGFLPSLNLKQIAHEVASAVEGVRHVVNRIEVSTPDGLGTSDLGRAGNLSLATKVLVERIAVIKHMAI